MIQQHEKVHQFDVLVVGGGIGGMSAAIAAAEAGVSVAVCEKANTLRSGSGATGNDHFICYLPQEHGDNIEKFIDFFAASPLSICADRKMIEKFSYESGKHVKNWEKWGIPMRPLGFYEFSGHGVPGQISPALKYAGVNQKRLLTKEALRQGVKIFNRMPVSELLTDTTGAVCGAVAVDISDEKPVMHIFQAKGVVLATGNTSRLYTPKTGAMLFNLANCPACTGGGRAMAYKVGARLVNLDVPHAHAGLKNLNRCGKGTWIGVYSDIEGNPVGQFIRKPTKKYGDATGDHWHDIFNYRYKMGEPVYMNCTETEQEDLDYMYWGLSNEGNQATLNYLDEMGIDLHREMLEFMQYEPILVGRGIDTNVDASCTVPGLYAAGEETGNFRGDIGGAATFGWIAGESAATRAKNTDFSDISNHQIVDSCREAYSMLLERNTDAGTADWKEVNIAIQQIMSCYAGLEVRSDHLYRAGLTYLNQIQERMEKELACACSHDFFHCLEIMDLLLVGKLVMICGNERRETRHLHKRIDFPYTSPVYNNKFLTVQQENGVPLLAWRNQE